LTYKQAVAGIEFVLWWLGWCFVLFLLCSFWRPCCLGR
jgi:hypothetical protein